MPKSKISQSGNLNPRQLSDQQIKDTSVSVVSSDPSPSIILKKRLVRNKDKLFPIISVVVIVALIGAVIYFGLKKPTVKPIDYANKDISEKIAKLPVVQPEEEKTTGSYKPTYELQPPSETTTLIARIQSIETNEFSDDPSNVATITHPKDWQVYRKKMTSTDPFPEIIIKSGKGHNLKVISSSGAGGDCPLNDEPYTLIKKLPTKTPGFFFTQYSSSRGDRGLQMENLNNLVRDLGSSEGDVASLKRHQILKEGESNTNTCNIGVYPKAFLAYMVRITSETDGSTGSELTWDKIKDDTEFVNMLQSIDIKSAN